MVRTQTAALADLAAAALPVQAGEDALALLGQLVALDPSRRPSAAAALRHRYFRAAPAPTPAGQLPQPPVRARNPLALAPKVGF
jgi:cyclin-dependent kinase 7